MIKKTAYVLTAISIATIAVVLIDYMEALSSYTGWIFPMLEVIIATTAIYWIFRCFVACETSKLRKR